MLTRHVATSNSERQRQFRKRNPGYYTLRQREARAAATARRRAELLAMVQAIVARREPLALPAPVEVLEIPGLNAIPTMAEFLARRAEVKVAVAAS